MIFGRIGKNIAMLAYIRNKILTVRRIIEKTGWRDTLFFDRIKRSFEKEKSNMKSFHESYETIREEKIDDIHSMGYVLKHKKSGAKVALVENDDDNKVFYIGFRTPVSDSTGVPHINEHSVLCGSDKYPLKDPFVELVKGSLNTFLNAITYPDKTVYPVASVNDQDFKNLMDVYMDAVLHPLIYSRPEIFKQEGWHYEMEDIDSELTINGVVYNEMKGAFSSPDDVLQRSIINSLFPDTNYGFESGGDPKDIPSLTYENFLDFHKKFYHPCNSYIYLYGDMDFTERLDYLDKEYLSKYEIIDVDSKIHHQKAFDKPVEVHKKYSISSDEDEKDQTYLSMNFVVSDNLNPVLYQAFEILDYALLNVPGAPLKKALIDAGIGAEIMGGYDNGTLQPFYSVVAKGANPEDKDRFVQIIKDVLKDQVENGIDHNALEAAINSSQFKYREADFGSYPKGLIYGLQILDSWLYEDDQPFMHMHGIEILDDLRKKLDEGYFEKLTDMYLLSNDHVSVVVVEPEKGLTQKEDEELRNKLAKYKESLSEEEKQRIVDETKALREYQQSPETEENIKKLPMLKRSDLSKKARPIDLTVHDEFENTILHHDIETNGINYFNLVFKTENITFDELPYLELLTIALGSVDTKKRSYFEFANEVNIHTGGMNSSLRVYPKEDGSYVINTEFKTKFLFEKKDKAFELLEEMIFESDFSDEKRLHEIIREEKSQDEARAMSAGHIVASQRAASYYSKTAAITEATNGISFYRFLKDLDENFEEKGKELKGIFEDLLKRIVRKENLIISTIGKEEALSQASDYLPKLSEKLFTDEVSKKELHIDPQKKNEGFKNAAKIQYVCRAGNFKDAGHEYKGTLRILKVILGYEYFWQKVRVEGGAYGCMSNFTRTGALTFVSYRDPNLKNTIDVFENTADFLKDFDADEREMTKYIIGTLSGIDTPMTPSQRGSRGLSSYLTGTTYEMMQKTRDEIINANAEDIRALAPLVKDTMDEGYLCVIGNEENIEEQKDIFMHVESLF